LGPVLDKLRPDINFGNAHAVTCACHGARAKKAFAMPMNAAEEYRLVAWDCLKMAEVTSDPETHWTLCLIWPNTGPE